jgi:hypothetical protein
VWRQRSSSPRSLQHRQSLTSCPQLSFCSHADEKLLRAAGGAAHGELAPFPMYRASRAAQDRSKEGREGEVRASSALWHSLSPSSLNCRMRVCTSGACLHACMRSAVSSAPLASCWPPVSSTASSSCTHTPSSQQPQPAPEAEQGASRRRATQQLPGRPRQHAWCSASSSHTTWRRTPTASPAGAPAL